MDPKDSADFALPGDNRQAIRNMMRWLMWAHLEFIVAQFANMNGNFEEFYWFMTVNHKDKLPPVVAA